MLDLFEECIGIGRVVELVDPKNSIEIVRTDVRDVVRIPDRHIDKRGFLSVEFERQLFIRSDLAEFDCCLPLDDRETFDFACMVVIAARDSGSGRREGDLAAELVKFHGLHKCAAIIGVLLQFEREKILVVDISAERIEKLNFKFIVQFREDSLLKIKRFESVQNCQDL